MRAAGRQEQGQVLVIFAGSLVLLALIAALVFDVGMNWMIQRQQQNAADPAALAAAKYVPSVPVPLAPGNNATPAMVAAACYYANANGFFPSGYNTTANGCTSKTDPKGPSLTVYYPPQGPNAGSYIGRPGYVQVLITLQRQTFFLGIIGQSTSTVTAAAVAANTSGDSNSYSLLALDPNGGPNDGSQIGGTGGTSTKVTISPAPGVTSGGYVQVNSSYPTVPPPALAPCQNTGNGALQINGGGSIQAPAIFVTGQCGPTGAQVTTDAGSSVTQGALPVGDPLADLPRPDPTSMSPGQCGTGGPVTAPGTNPPGCGNGSMKWTPDGPCPDGSGASCVSLKPGIYYGGWSIPNKTELQLAAGIYYIAGGGINVTGTGAITSVSGSSGPAPVMIFSSDEPGGAPLYRDQCLAGTINTGACQGGLSMDAQTSLDLAGMDSGTYKGMLLWQDGNGSCSINKPTSCPVVLGGQTSLNISGTVYAPGVSVTLDGGSGVGGTAAIQIISWQWKIVGNSQITMPYDPNQLYHLEQRGLVH